MMNETSFELEVVYRAECKRPRERKHVGRWQLKERGAVGQIGALGRDDVTNVAGAPVAAVLTCSGGLALGSSAGVMPSQGIWAAWMAHSRGANDRWRWWCLIFIIFIQRHVVKVLRSRQLVSRG
jgi:hypothetical protein